MYPLSISCPIRVTIPSWSASGKIPRGKTVIISEWRIWIDHLVETSRLRSYGRKIYSDRRADTAISAVPSALKHLLSLPKRVSIRTRRPRARRTTTTTGTEITRRQDDPAEDSPITSSPNSDTNNSGDSSSVAVCDICHERQPHYLKFIMDTFHHLHMWILVNATYSSITQLIKIQSVLVIHVYDWDI